MIPNTDKGEETPKQEIPFEFMQFPGVKGSNIHERTREQEREEIKNWINQADPHLEQKEDEILTWFVMSYGALEELCKLKKLKDELDFSSEGNPPELFANEYADYKGRKKMAWHMANEVIELWKKSDYGARPLPKSALKEDNTFFIEDVREFFDLYKNKQITIGKLTELLNEKCSGQSSLTPKSISDSNGWISVEDRLPDANDTCEDYYNEVLTLQLGSKRPAMVKYWEVKNSPFVKLWMPLPALPGKSASLKPNKLSDTK